MINLINQTAFATYSLQLIWTVANERVLSFHAIIFPGFTSWAARIRWSCLIAGSLPVPNLRLAERSNKTQYSTSFSRNTEIHAGCL